MYTFIYYYDLVILTDPTTYLLSCVISSASRRHKFLLNAMFKSLVSISSINWKILLTHKTTEKGLIINELVISAERLTFLWHIMFITQTDWFEQ